MLAKNLYCNVEVTFWDTVIIILSGLKWFVINKRKLFSFLCQAIAWASLGFLVGLISGYVIF